MNRLFPLLILFALLVVSPLIFSACASSSEREFKVSRSAMVCQLDHGRVRDKVVTDLGEIYIYEIVRACKRTGNWVMRAFHDDDHRGTMTLEYLRTKPTSVTAEYREPYWLRFSAMDDGTQRVWDFIARRREDGRMLGRACRYNDEGRHISINDDFDLLECLGPNDWYGSSRSAPAAWAIRANYPLNDPEAFDAELFAMIEERREDAEFLSWIALFVSDTWEDRSAAGRERAAAAMERIDCETLMRSEDEYWKQFVTSGRAALGEIFTEEVSICDQWLLQNHSTEFDKILPRLDDPAMVERVDATIDTAGDDIDDDFLALWVARLDHDPRPSQALLDSLDRFLVRERRFDMLVQRLNTGVEMTESLQEQLREDFTECCAHHHEAQQVLEHPMLGAQE